MNNTSSIPFLDLVTPHRELESELIQIFTDSLRHARFIGGPMVEEFEKEFARYCDTKHCIGVNSGTDALRFALIAAGIRRGDTVITVPNTFIATTEAISQAGGVIDFVDIDEKTYNMDPLKLSEYLDSMCYVDDSTGKVISKNTGSPIFGIIPVHIYGQVADMDSINTLCAKYRLVVIEDSCQAHGARYYSAISNSWQTAGSMGSAAAFSFYPGKNLGACGEAGAVTTNDDSIAGMIRMIRDHGQSQKYFHDIEGYNGRLDAIQAGILRTKLGHLSKWNSDRQQCAMRYHSLLSNVDGIIAPYDPQWSESVYHLYVIRTTRRDELKDYLAANGISTGLHYPLPLHLQKAYSSSNYKRGDYPVAEKVADELLSLPLYPGLSEDQQIRVVSSIRDFTGDYGTH